MPEEHNHHNQSGKNLRIVFFLNLGFAILEIIGGLYVNSIAIISDAIHDVGDSFAIGLSWYFDKKSKQKRNARYSYGYKRYSLLGALTNSFILVVGSIFIINEAISRLMHPESSNADGMILFALIGVLVNGYAAWKMSHGKSLNEKVISWHLIEDVLGWLAILVVAIILQFYENNYLDPALSLFITAYILWNVIKRLKETIQIFLQAVPKDKSVQKVEQELLKIKQVASIHHTHIWSLEGENHVFSTHLKLKLIGGLAELKSVKKEIINRLQSYGFNHTTVEIEFDDEDCSNTLE